LTSILYYITGHGYGHAVRASQVVRRLLETRSDLTVHIRTTAPDWLFYDPLSRVVYTSEAVDIGIIQADSLEMNISETLKACQAVHNNLPRLIEQETTFVRDHGIDLILGDIPPLGFEIAAQASIPSAAISNFTWSWIYRAYSRQYPEFLSLVDEMEGFYRKATLALALPYSCGMDVFPKREAIPWITRRSVLTKEEARSKFRLPNSPTIVLLSFGGFGLERLPWDKLKRLREFFFIATGDTTKRNGNVLVLSSIQRRYEDLLRAVDVVVTKPGYGIVADAIAHQVPILYTDRGEFPEYPFLVRALVELATSEYITQEDLLAGNMGAYLNRLLAKKRKWPSVPLDGAMIAARIILTLLDRQPP
jgi:Glycosyl transferase family 1